MAGFIDGFFDLATWGYYGRFRQALRVANAPVFQNNIIAAKAPVLVDMENLLQVYSVCPPLQMVLLKKAEMLSNGTLKMRKKSTGEDIEKHPMLDLMKNPNPLQGRREFIFEWSLYNDIYSNVFNYANRAFAGRPPKTIWNLPTGYIKIIPTGKWLDQIDLKGIIDSYELYGIGVEWNRKFTTDEVSHYNSGISRNPLMSDSKLLALQMPISNIIAAYKTRNCLINENAGITVISSKASKDADGSVPTSPEEKKQLNDDFKKTYGLMDNQSRKIISPLGVDVTPLIFPVRDMLLFEEIEDDLGQICGTIGIDRDCFPSIKGATFENKRQGEISSYEGTVKTTANAFCNFMDTILLGDEDAEFYLDYDSLYILQADKESGGRAKMYATQAASLAYHDGIISKETYAEEAEFECTGDGIIKSIAPATPINEPPKK